MTPDATAMRTAAQRLRVGADRLRVNAATIAGNVDAMAFAGPAADRFRAATTDRMAALRSAAAQLDDGATRLLGAAIEVELQQSVGGSVTVTMPTLFRSRLSMPVPDGWYPTETMALTGPGGQSAVTIEGHPIAPGADLRPIADAHLAALIGAIEGATAGSLSEAKGFGDRAVLVGRTSALTGDRAVAVRTAYFIEGSWAYLATGAATVVDGDFDGAGAELEALLLTARLPGGPTDRFGYEGGPTRSGSRRLAPASETWADARVAWESATTPADVVLATATYTVEQVAAAAQAYGASSAAGVDFSALDGLPPAVRQAVVASSTRGLIAGGLLARDRSAESGTCLVDLDSPLGLAVAHDLLVIVERSGPTGTTRRTFAARTDIAVEVAPIVHGGTDTGMAEMTMFPAAGLVGRVKVAVGLAPERDATAHDALDLEIADRDLRAAIAGARARTPDAAPVDDALAISLGSLEATLTVRIVARQDAGVAGAELQLLDAGPAGWFLVESMSSSGGWGRVRVRRRSAAELTETLLTHLPGRAVAPRSAP